MVTELESKRSALIAVLALWQIGFISLIFIICIFFTHKIAGPMYKLQKFLAKVREGGGYDKIYFRNGDYFHEVADDVNKTFEYLRDDHNKDIVYLSEVNKYIKKLSDVVPEDKKETLKEIETKLNEIQHRFQETVKE
jgi:hypothetical protein